MPADTAAAVQKLKEENAAMEKEIMALTKGTMGAADATLVAAPMEMSGIKVLKYGADATGGGAGEDHGSAWCPASCGRRTVLGGFFTS